MKLHYVMLIATLAAVQAQSNSKGRCESNKECALERACIKQQCVDPCTQIARGNHTLCQACYHVPIVTCAPGHVADSTAGCIPELFNPNEKPMCTVNSECPGNLACIQEKCVDPCINKCGANTECQVHGKRPLCLCLAGFTGCALRGCLPITPLPPCTGNNGCPTLLACIQGKCADPCENACGANALCEVREHTPLCSCSPGFFYHPTSGCTPEPAPQCTENKDCPALLACKQRKCVDPCENTCGANAMCKVQDHQSLCSCIPGFIHNPILGCIPEPVSACTGNNDCPGHLACIRGKCLDPCENACGANAVCEVRDHQPLCSCNPGYTGCPLSGCTPVTEPGCTGNNDCPGHLACRQRTCIDPCENACGANAVCDVRNHQPHCTCISGYVFRPPSDCIPDPVSACTGNNDCPVHLACIRRKCLNPCENACGVNTVCEVRDHHPLCSCKPDFTGNPVTGCNPVPACTGNNDCLAHLACIRRKCLNPCENACGANTVCEVRDHTPLCSCKPGSTGYPVSGCIPVSACTGNNDCLAHLACIRGKCLDPCQNACGVNTVCEVRDHQRLCSCKPGYIGCPISGCIPEPTVTPTDCTLECAGNDQCPPGRACVDHRCVDPCPGRCGGNSTCKVVNHVPSCECLPGHTGNPFESCRHQPGGSTQPGSICLGNIGVKKFVTHTKKQLDWLQAALQCRKNGHRLATIMNQQELDNIKKAIRDTDIRNGNFWIAGTDHLHNKEWYWFTTDGMERIGPIRDWMKNRPLGDVEDCLEFWELNLQEGYKWNNKVCYIKQYFICEYFV